MRFIPLSQVEEEEDKPYRFVPLEADAGGGRGFVNPPRVFEKQPVRSAPPAPVEPTDYGQASTDMMGTPMSAPSAPASPAKPRPYKNRLEALDDAVNLVEEGLDFKRVAESFTQIDIGEGDIIAHGIKRKSPMFQDPGLSRRQIDQYVKPELRPMPQPTAEVRPVETTAMEEVGNTLRRGQLNARQGVDNLAFSAGLMDSGTMAERMRERQRAVGAAAPSGDVAAGLERLQEANETGDYGVVAGALIRPENWKALAALVAESAVASSPAILTTVAGTVLAGPVGGAAAAGLSSLSMEYGAAIGEELQKRSVNLSDALAVRRTLEDDQFLQDARDRGIKRGIPVAAFDALSAGFAGRFLRTVQKAADGGTIAGRAVPGAFAGAALKEAGLQVGSGVAGEGIAQIATGENKPLDVFIEGLAELPGGAFEVAGNLRSARGMTPEARLAGAIQSGVDSATFTGTDAAARAAMSPYSNADTNTRGGIVGGAMNFTPQGSITAEAGLAPIVVPMGAGQQTGGVNGGLPDVLGGLAGGSGVAGGGDPLAGLGSPGRDAGLPGRGGANAQGALVGDGGLALPGAGAGQPGPSLAAGRGERATDADLLARAGQASEGAPAKIWAGRAGDGYAQQQDAQQAFPSLQRRYPDLSWSMQQDADGKFYWSGRSTGESNGSVAGAAGQGLAGVPGVGSAGQEADAGAGVVGFGPSRIGQPGQPGGASTVGSASPDGPAFTLNLAPPAPRQTVLRAITSVKSAQGVDIEFEAQSLTDQQKVASAMARLVGKTVTFYTHKAGPAAAVPNGFVLDGNDRDIFLDKSSNDGALFVMMHEGVHALPQPIREKLVETLKGLTKTDMRSDFATRFSYDINNDYQIDNEIAAFMTQAVSKRKDFWQELRTKMGDGDFAEVAKVIISKLDTFIRGANQAYGEDFLKRYATDAVGVRDAVSTAYAQAMKAQGQQAPAGAAGTGVSPSNRAADVNPMGMYSELARKIDAGPGQAMPDQWRGYIRGLTTKGVKPDEIEWSGVEDFISLKGGKVSKQEVADYLKQGGVKVEETVLRDSGDPFLDNATKYDQYTLPGGKNNREVLLTLPVSSDKMTSQEINARIQALDKAMDSADGKEWDEMQAERLALKQKWQDSKQYEFRSKHWDQPNVLAHIRMNDRTDADGKRVLFVEEIQSDWGQEGKKKGFAGDVPVVTAERVGPWYPSEPDGDGKFRVYVDGRDAGMIRAESVENAIQIKTGALGNLASNVPRAPFVTKTEGWLNLALKRVMTMAAEGGYDRVAFVSGEQSADRYDLSKKISKIRYDQYSSGNGQLFAYDNGGYLAIDKPATPEDLADMIGKEVASRLMDQQPKDAVSSGGSRARRRELSGLDLKVGGEGMKAFYDTIVPTALKKLLPKVGGGQMGGVQFDATGEGRFSVFDEDSGEMVWRGKTREDAEEFVSTYGGDASIKEGSKDYDKFGGTQPGFDITPAMREKVATTGLPMFSKKVTEGADGAATAGAQGIASASRSEVEKAEDYERENGILPYTSDGQIEVPVRIQLSVKLLGKYEQHPILDIPVNKNGTVTLYYPTTNEEARRVARDKTLKASPGSNRIYLTNESSAPKVMNQRGNIEQRLEGANVLVQVDPSLLQLDMEHSDGRKDFFIPLAEGKEFFNKMRMTRLFTQNAPRSKALTKDTRLTDLERRISDGIDKYVGLTKSEQRIRLKEAKSVLSREHNVTTLLGVNGKLEKTNTGGYGLNNYDGKDVKSMGLGLASAQKINEQNLSTCPKSAICEGLCLGETSGQNKLYGGDGQYRSGPRLSQYLKTEAMVVHPEEFAVVLHSEIAKLERNANKEDYQATVRLNVTSDFRPQTFKAIISAFPDVVFYDYTKLPTKSIASNHHLTYSSTGASQVVDGKTIFNPESNWNKMVAVMGRGDNVAMAFSDKTTMPKYVVDGKTGERFQVWNGDNYDARFLDPKPGATGNEFNKGMVIGLTNKDRTVKPELAAKKNQGFFIDYNPERDGDTVTIKDQDALASDRKTIAIKLAPSEVEGKAGDAPIASNRAVPVTPQPKAPTPATVIVGGRTLRIPDPAGAVETLDAKINRYSELLKCLQ